MNKLLLCLVGVLLALPAGVFGQEEYVTAPAETATIIRKVKLRREPRNNSLPYRYLTKGEQVSLVGMRGNWSEIETRWKFDSGAPMTGFVPTTSLNRDTRIVAPTPTPAPANTGTTAHAATPTVLISTTAHTEIPVATWQVIGMAGPTNAYLLTPDNTVRSMELGEIVNELQKSSAETRQLKTQLAEQKEIAARLAAELRLLKEQRAQARFTVPTWIMGEFLEARLSNYSVGLQSSDTKCIIRLHNQDWLASQESLAGIATEMWTDPNYTYLLVPPKRVTISIGQPPP